MRSNYLGVAGLCLNVIVLLLSGALYIEKQNGSQDTNIAVIEQKLESIDKNTSELKTAFQSHLEVCNSKTTDLEKRIIHLEINQTDNLRTAYFYHPK